MEQTAQEATKKQEEFKQEEFKQEEVKQEVKQQAVKQYKSNEAKQFEARKKKQQEEIKQQEPSYKNAQNVETYDINNNKYTAYYGVPNTESKVYGNKQYRDTTQDNLNNEKIEFITFGQDNKKNIYEFTNKKDLFDYVKSIGGFKELNSEKIPWSIKSATNEGEFYLVRDKNKKGGWIWRQERESR